jgi:aspartate oxidase
MSHSITLFNELNLTNKLLILVNYSNQTNTKIRIRKSEILTKTNDNSGYKLSQNNTLTFMENHLGISRNKERQQILNQFLQEIKQVDIKSKINVKELQKSNKLNQSRILTARIASARV